MKTKKLIELLQKEDPSGEEEVFVSTEDGNLDIFFIETKPGYWDGCKQILVRDWNCKNYNVIGAEYRSDGNKICIIPMGIRDALEGNPDLPVKVVDTFVDKKMQKWIDEQRNEIKEIYVRLRIRDVLENNPDLPVKVVDAFVDKKMQEWVDEPIKGRELFVRLPEGYHIEIVPKKEWPEGKPDPTEYNDETGIIRIRDDYDYKTDPAGWLVHEKAHADYIGSRVANDYPGNPIERYAYTQQLKYLKSKGYEFKDIFKIPAMEQKEIYLDFLKELWDDI